MRIHECRIDNFTVFRHQQFKFCPGLNVLIGTNGTGKTHVMKALYAILKGTIESDPEDPPPDFAILRNLKGVFKPENGNLRHLLNSMQKDRASCKIFLNDFVIEYGFNKSDVFDSISNGSMPKNDGLNLVYIPPNDVLAMYPGFAAAYAKRELSFDQTYYDICRTLESRPLKKIEPVFEQVVLNLEQQIKGHVEQKGDRFYLRDEKNNQSFEAHLLAEGHRKIAALVHLINNGSINSNTILFWDEPEANLNPVLIRHVVDGLIDLVNAGVQLFIATHDYLLTGEISLVSEYYKSSATPILFHSLGCDGNGSVHVESGEVLADLGENPILDEFAAHYQREHQAAITIMKQKKN